MKDINQILDNEYMNEEYLDAEVIADNDMGDNLARIAHQIADDATCVDHENLDVGATPDYDLCKAMVVDHKDLDPEDAGEVLRIIRENYLPTNILEE